MVVKTERAGMDAAANNRRKDSVAFEIIPQEDGGYRLAVNGEIISCFYWSRDKLDECVRTVNRLMKADAR